MHILQLSARSTRSGSVFPKLIIVWRGQDDLVRAGDVSGRNVEAFWPPTQDVDGAVSAAASNVPTRRVPQIGDRVCQGRVGKIAPMVAAALFRFPP